jgi:hypothetical protein
VSPEGSEGCGGPCATSAPIETSSNVPIARRDVRNIIARPVSGLTSAFKSCWQIAFPRLSKDAVAFGFAVTRLPLRGQRRVWF